MSVKLMPTITHQEPPDDGVGQGRLSAGLERKREIREQAPTRNLSKSQIVGAAIAQGREGAANIPERQASKHLPFR